MRSTTAVLALSALITLSSQAQTAKPLVIVIHGGAGTLRKANMSEDLERQYHQALEAALRTGYAALESNRSALDAVEAAIRVMEDSPLFNAGKGAVFTHEGQNEHDASIMNGANKAAGAVAAVTIIKNPISAARAVMEKSPHVMLAGRGAELFATSVGLEIVDPSYFWTERRWKQLQDALVKERASGSAEVEFPEDVRFGTVGVVALDASGNLAAGTSTGGTSNKRHGRIGDSPIVGAGTWADNDSCAVSGTGDGEYFIRLALARDIAALVEYRNMSVQGAADEVVQKKLGGMGGHGGVIALDRRGNFAMVFNTEGMYRGYMRRGEAPKTLIYK